MTTSTLLWIIGAVILALGIALFQYYYKAKYSTPRNRIYTILRFLSVFVLLVLLINPHYKKTTYYIEKPALAIAVDNSESIAFLTYDDRVREGVNRFRESEALNETFDIQYYSFGTTTKILDSLNFEEKQTDINQAFKNIGAIYKGQTAPTIILSDGNQTLGTSFVYGTRNYKHPIYALAVGDTIVYDDLKLGQLNVNRYAYINNQFPVEIFASYDGTEQVQSVLTVSYAGRTVHRETLSFTPQTSSQVVNFLLPAERVGIRQYTVSLAPLQQEKNTNNNTKRFAIEVIDQKTNVALISALIHPDLGVLKKSITTNNLRSITQLTPEESLGVLDEYDVAILYQPTQVFAPVIEALDNLNKNRIIITGTETDWPFLNNAQTTIGQEVTGQTEDVQGVLNPNFSTFAITPIGFEDYPPLKADFGETRVNATHDVALYQKIGTIETEAPLLLTTENNTVRSVWLLGEGIWRWRAQCYLDNTNFEDFDRFIGQLVQYTASKKRKSRFNVDFESFYYGTSGVQMNAQYFDKNYIFDNRAVITIKVTNTESEEIYEAPFLLKRNSYTIDLSNLEAWNI